MRIGEKLRMIREANGLSQEDLAARLNVSVPAVSRWESGTRTFPADELVRIADALDVEPGTFYAAEPWGKIEEARRQYDAVIAEAQAIFKNARDNVPSPSNDHRTGAAHVDENYPSESPDFCSRDRTTSRVLALSL